MWIRSVLTISLILITGMTGCLRKGTHDTEQGSYQNSVRIRGRIENGAHEIVRLEEMAAREFIPLDTVTCDGSGAFEITFTPEGVAFYVLRYGPSGYVTLLIEPGEQISFTGHLGNTDTYQVEGSPGSALLRSLAVEHKATLNRLGDITRKNMAYASSPDYVERKGVFDRQFDSITSGFHDYSLRFIHDHSGSLAILVALYNLYGQALPVFDPETDLAVYRYADSVLMNRYSEFEAVQLLHAQVTEAVHLMNSDKQIDHLQKGEIAPDFVSSRPDGSQLALSDLRNDYVLLSFWAGWSRLSRDENETLREAMRLFGKRNFRILQVSFDDNREIWTRAIREDSLAWDHVSDLRRWETPVADLYHVEKIPFMVLIDPAGRVVESNLPGEELITRLQSIFGK